MKDVASVRLLIAGSQCNHFIETFCKGDSIQIDSILNGYHVSFHRVTIAVRDYRFQVFKGVDTKKLKQERSSISCSLFSPSSNLVSFNEALYLNIELWTIPSPLISNPEKIQAISQYHGCLFIENAIHFREAIPKIRKWCDIALPERNFETGIVWIRERERFEIFRPPTPPVPRNFKPLSIKQVIPKFTRQLIFSFVDTILISELERYENGNCLIEWPSLGEREQSDIDKFLGNIPVNANVSFDRYSFLSDMRSIPEERIKFMSSGSNYLYEKLEEDTKNLQEHVHSVMGELLNSYSKLSHADEGYIKRYQETIEEKCFKILEECKRILEMPDEERNRTGLQCLTREVKMYKTDFSEQRIKWQNTLQFYKNASPPRSISVSEDPSSSPKQFFRNLGTSYTPPAIYSSAHLPVSIPISNQTKERRESL